MTKHRYPYVRAWGEMMNLPEYQIEDQVALAHQEKAPADAMWRGISGKWHRYSEMLPHNSNWALVASYVKGKEDGNA